MNAEKEYILKIKEELDNLSERRQNMFNVSIVIMTALVIPLLWKITEHLPVIYKYSVKFSKICSNMLLIRQVVIIQLLYLGFISCITLLFTKIFLKHKYISSTKYEILDILIKNNKDTRCYKWEYKLLEEDYLNISKLEILPNFLI